MLIFYSFLLCVALGLFFAMRSCRSDAPASFLRQQVGSGGDTIDVALVYAPMSYYMYGDTLGGYNYDLMRDIAREEGITMKFRPVNSLAEALILLREGKYDIIATLPEDAEYKKLAIYSDPVFLDRQVLVQRVTPGQKPRVQSALDLARDTVHIEAGSPIAARIRNLSSEIGDTIYVCEHADISSELLVLEVQSGKIKYAVVNEKIAQPLTRRFEGIDAGSPISFTQFQGIVAAPGDTAMIRMVNGWLQRADTRPSVKKLRERYGL